MLLSSPAQWSELNNWCFSSFKRTTVKWFVQDWLITLRTWTMLWLTIDISQASREIQSSDYRGSGYVCKSNLLSFLPTTDDKLHIVVFICTVIRTVYRTCGWLMDDATYMCCPLMLMSKLLKLHTATTNFLRLLSTMNMQIMTPHLSPQTNWMACFPPQFSSWWESRRTVHLIQSSINTLIDLDIPLQN